MCPPIWDLFLSISCTFYLKTGCAPPHLWQNSAPRFGKSWIRHWQLLVMYTLFTKHLSKSCWFPTTIHTIILDCLATEEIDVFSVRWTDDIPGDCRTLHPRRSVSLYRLRHTASRHVLRFLRFLFGNWNKIMYLAVFPKLKFDRIRHDFSRWHSAQSFPFLLYWGLQCEKRRERSLRKRLKFLIDSDWRKLKW